MKYKMQLLQQRSGEANFRAGLLSVVHEVVMHLTSELRRLWAVVLVEVLLYLLLCILSLVDCSRMFDWPALRDARQDA